MSPQVDTRASRLPAHIRGARRWRTSAAGRLLAAAAFGAAALAASICPGMAAAATRVGGDVNLLYRHDGGEALGVAFRRVTFNRRANATLSSDLMGPRLGNYQLSGGLDFLSSDGAGRGRDDTRRRLDARVQLLPRSPVSLTGFYSLVRSSVSGGFLESSHADAWGGSAAARLLPRGTTQAERERREDDALGGTVSLTDRVHHTQSLVLGPLAMNANYDFSNRRLDAAAQAVSYRAEHHTGRVDEQLQLGALGRLRSWVQLDRERSRTLRGSLPERGFDNEATSAELETPLGKRASLRQAYADELYRYSTDGNPSSLRFRIGEERFDGRLRAGERHDVRLLVRGQYNRTERQPDLWLASALAEFQPTKPDGWSVSPRAGANVFAGGVGDGRSAGEILGVRVALHRPTGSFELEGGRERTRANGLTGRLDGDGLRGFSVRQSGTQRVHSVRVAASLARGAAAFRQDYEFQQVRNTTLGIDFVTHRATGSVTYRVNERLWTDLSGDYQSTDQSGIYFGGLRQSVSGTLSVGARPGAGVEVSSRASYGRVPSGARESFWLMENSILYRIARLDLQLLQRNEKRASEPGFPDVGRSERLYELRATRQFARYL
jgi:hypothetical protein